MYLLVLTFECIHPDKWCWSSCEAR